MKRALFSLAVFSLILGLACSLIGAPAQTEERPPLGEENLPAAQTISAPPQSGPAAPVQCSDAEPPLVTDLDVRQPPVMSEPAPRSAFRDPVFGRCLVRVTARGRDKSEPGGLKNEYSRVQSFNADETRILVMGTQGGWYLYNAQNLQPLGALPLGIDPRWSETDPSLIYYSEETRLMSYNIVTQQTAVVHEFADDFPGQNLAAVWGRYEGSPSRDGRWWGLMAEDEDWLTSALLVYDLQTNQVTAALDTRGWPAEAREMDSVTISPLGNYFLVYMDLYCERGQLGTPSNPCGLMVYDRNLQNGRGLLRIVGHSDTALDAQGREVLVYQDIDTDYISMLDLATGVVTLLWPIDFTYTGIGLHLSGRAFNRPGWAVISTHDGDTASHTWMDDSVFLIELAPNGRVVRLAHTHSLVDESQEHDYWAEPQASANRDLTRVLFTTNWNRSGTEQVEMYQIYVPPEAFATAYYVAPNGNDSNPGTFAQPWRTIQKAADTLTAGEMVYIRGGTYREQVVPQNSGSEGNFITYAAYPGETVTIDGAAVNLPEWEGLFHIANVSFIRVSGLRVVNVRSNPHNPGILSDGSSHIMIENNFVSAANDSGIGVWNSDHVTVKNNEVTNSCLAGFNENITVGGTDTFEISGNRVHDSDKEGIDVKDGSSNGKVFGNEVYNTAAVGLYVDAWDKHTYNIDVYQNVVHDVQDDGFALASEMGGLLENIRVYNNLSYNNRYVGIAVTRNGDSAAHPMRGVSIVNNTVSGNGLSDWGGGITVDSNEAVNVRVSNNIVSGNLSFQIVVGPGAPSAQVIIDHNLIDGFRGEEGETRGTNYVEGDPRFVDPAAANYRLLSDSPAIDAGDNASLPAEASADLDGNPRIVGGTVDMGAYEFGSAAATTATFRSQADYDGWILETAESSNRGGTMNSASTVFLLGDDRLNRQYRAILSFNTASLPDNAVIVRVTLRIKRQGLTGSNPFLTHGRIIVDIRKGFFSTLRNLQPNDFQAAASRSRIGLLSNNPQSGGWYSVLLDSAAFAYINLSGLTQFRLRFALDDDNDRRIGVVWHTQGAGKSLTMAFYAGRIVLHPAMQNPTIVVITNRNDLDDQLFGTFSRCSELLRQVPEQAESREDLRAKLRGRAAGGVIPPVTGGPLVTEVLTKTAKDLLGGYFIVELDPVKAADKLFEAINERRKGLGLTEKAAQLAAA